MTTTNHTSTKQDILEYLLKHRQARAQQLAEALEISPQAIRRHLKDLEAEGLILHQAVSSGMGRPQHLYQLSNQGKAKFPHRYGEFAVSFLDTLVETVGEEQMGLVLRKQWERKAHEYRQRLGDGSLAERVARLVKLRQEEGYMAELHQTENTGNGQKLIFSEHNCAISDVAESYPTVCGHELDMFSAILPDCIVERTQWINNGQHLCGYSIRAK
jgi:DeoR family suf operon transcriptional repressor